MKPDTTTAMKILIKQIKVALPFDMPEHEICAGKCVGCPKKMMEYIGFEIDYWQCKLDNDEIPTFGDINDLARIAKKVYRSMAKNKLV